MKYYLAIDIGASSGRLLLAHMENGEEDTQSVSLMSRTQCSTPPAQGRNGVIRYEEIHRFANGMKEEEGHKVWDLDELFSEILTGMKKCVTLGKIPVSMGIDTWGVDYVLLDQKGERVGKSYAYRDSRTEGMDEEVYRIIPEDKLYEKTGIQKAIFNTIYQLMAAKKQEPETLEKADALLMLPDYFHFLLTGVKKQEYTNATTSGMINPETKEWDRELIGALGFPEKLFGPLSMPGTEVGHLLPEIREQVGFDCRVVLPATHDTGSAVMSVPGTSDNVLYISSGTWSLFGCEAENAICTEAARKANFTNEGGYEYRYRFLKNIMGLWMIQSVKKELEEGWEYPGKTGREDYSFANLCDLARSEKIDSVVDANSNVFLAPSSMIDAVRKECERTGQQVPNTPWEIARVIYRSLAKCYGEAAKELEAITGKTFDAINVVGGGSNAEYLNLLTAQETGKTVYAGPSEATAIGNIGAQMIADKVFSSLKDFRQCVFESFGVKTY
jgi:rhamnulokinase